MSEPKLYGYAKNKAEATQYIHEMYEDGRTEAELTFGVAMRFGFGEKLVKDYLKMRRAVQAERDNRNQKVEEQLKALTNKNSKA